MGITNLQSLRKFGSVGVDLDSRHLQFIQSTGFDLSGFVRKALDEEMEYYEWTADNKTATRDLVKARDELRNTDSEILKAIGHIATLYNRSAELDNDITEILYTHCKDWKNEMDSWRTHNKPVNKREDGQEFHHMHLNINGEVNKKIGIYIPKELHRSIHHNSNTGKLMKKMNKAALLWLCEQAEI